MHRGGRGFGRARSSGCEPRVCGHPCLSLTYTMSCGVARVERCITLRVASGACRHHTDRHSQQPLTPSGRHPRRHARTRTHTQAHAHAPAAHHGTRPWSLNQTTSKQVPSTHKQQRAPSQGTRSPSARVYNAAHDHQEACVLMTRWRRWTCRQMRRRRCPPPRSAAPPRRRARVAARRPPACRRTGP